MNDPPRFGLNQQSADIQTPLREGAVIQGEFVSASRFKKFIRVLWLGMGFLLVVLLGTLVWVGLDRHSNKTAIENIQLDQANLLTVQAGSDLEQKLKDFTTQLEALQNTQTSGQQGLQGERGEPGMQGQRGTTGVSGQGGAPGAAGAQGPTGNDGKDGIDGTATCPNGVCVSLQSESGPTVQETGNLNISGSVSFGELQTVAAATIGSTLHVADAAQLDGTLSVTGGAVFAASVSVAGTINASAFILNCPGGYIAVPGNSKFGTQDFCIMKYEAKNASGVAVSTASGTPWATINHQSAQDVSRAAGGHLITEPEWMTIATDVLWQPANWCNLDGSACGFTPGTSGKYLAAGHNDGSAEALTAGNDSQPCFGTVTEGTDTVCGSTAGTQKRTLTLSNGEVIWDFSGNLSEWTDAWLTAAEQPTAANSYVDTLDHYEMREWTSVNKRWGALQYANPTNRNWNSAQRLGQLYSLDDSPQASTDYTQNVFRRGGGRTSGSSAGVFSLNLSGYATLADVSIGFRVAR